MRFLVLQKQKMQIFWFACTFFSDKKDEFDIMYLSGTCDWFNQIKFIDILRAKDSWEFLWISACFLEAQISYQLERFSFSINGYEW